ncbi:hypothetical protein D9M68_688210 [compost metagenome]
MRGSLTWSRVSWTSSTPPARRDGATVTCLTYTRMFEFAIASTSGSCSGKATDSSNWTMVKPPLVCGTAWATVREKLVPL